mgnify:CR=1 FL=1
MATSDLTQAEEEPPDVRPAVPRWLSRPRNLAIAGIAAIAAGLVLNWGWLTAVGAAPILLSLLPCAAMCALGLCMRGGASNACRARSAEKVTAHSSDVLPQRPPKR